MRIGRRRMLAAAGAGLAAASVAGSRAAEETTPLANLIAADGKAIRVIEIMADADGHAIIKPVDMPADASPHPLFKQFLTHKAAAVAIYYVPANLHVPASFEPSRRLLYIVSGDTTLIAGQDEHPCPAGTAIIFDGKSDLKARSGKAGYTAIKVQLAD